MDTSGSPKFSLDSISAIDGQIASALRSFFDQSGRPIIQFCKILLEHMGLDADLQANIPLSVLVKTIHDTGIECSSQQIQELVELFGGTDEGINLNEFIRGLKGGLNSKRLELVHAAWILLDWNGQGVSAEQTILTDAKAKFNALDHPRVQIGELDADRVLGEFIDYWEADRPDGTIELIEWEYYYTGVSANIDTDAYFERLMSQCWPGMRMPEPHSPVQSTLDVCTRRLMAMHHQKLERLVGSSRTFRSALDLCFYRQSIPMDRTLSRDNLIKILKELYSIAGVPADEDSFDSIYKRIKKDLQRTFTVSDYEPALRESIRKELRFLEYRIFARTIST
ncbi:uncharacterized protein BJ171DRAFT_599287 [Polychytrium aggregatum]|uniref:uncharacterized protein n=1 Tax=Polychytrium aggregatum TaxID=110093 RepID=UPI0022FE611F|nr:uncharacterized protein BJ171DRAFT_599287 [Polychytrium aggregatum]KAI9204497.1 hypothetical protein BJ171DRAFT_599287 [Polychytrium aggregatum]